MKCLTVRSPWAQLIVTGHKRVECRARNTLYRGEILIHSAGKPWAEPCPGWLDDFLAGVGVERPEPVFSAILGSVRLVDVVPAEHRDELPDDLKPWALPGFGFYWVLADPRPLPCPVPFRGGQLGLYDAPHSLVNYVRPASDRIGVSTR